MTLRGARIFPADERQPVLKADPALRDVPAFSHVSRALIKEIRLSVVVREYIGVARFAAVPLAFFSRRDKRAAEQLAEINSVVAPP